MNHFLETRIVGMAILRTKRAVMCLMICCVVLSYVHFHIAIQPRSVNQIFFRVNVSVMVSSRHH
jgi:hypothetical protein